MEEGNHHVASVAQEVDYATIFRTRKKVAFKMHRRPKATIVTPIVNVWNKMIKQIIRHVLRIKAVNDPCEKISHPGVARFRITHHKDVLGKRLVDPHEA